MNISKIIVVSDITKEKSRNSFCDVVTNILRPSHVVVCYSVGYKPKKTSTHQDKRIVSLVILIGNVYSYLTIQKQFFSKLLGQDRVECLCKCGTVKIFPTKYVIYGNSKSCGCLKEEILEQRNTVDRVGHRFGYLTVLSDTGERTIKKGRNGNAGPGNVLWLCLCDCGNTTKVRSCHLTSKHTTSCGKCYKKSKLHLNTKKALEELSLSFEEEYVLDRSLLNGYNNKKSHLRIDFFVDTPKGYVAVECQGRQHYKCVDYWGGEEHWILQQERDLAKKTILKMCNIPLIEVKYNCKDIKMVLEEKLFNS